MRRSRDDPTVVLRSLEKLWSLSPTAEDLRECELLGVLYCWIYPEYRWTQSRGNSSESC